MWPGKSESCLRYCKSTIFQANHNYHYKYRGYMLLFAILQKYDFSSKSQQSSCQLFQSSVVCDTAKVRFFKQITTTTLMLVLFVGCLRYCKSTIFQANHNTKSNDKMPVLVVCDTAKVRFFKQITTRCTEVGRYNKLFAILQKYDFSSKSQQHRAYYCRR